MFPYSFESDQTGQRVSFNVYDFANEGIEKNNTENENVNDASTIEIHVTEGDLYDDSDNQNLLERNIF